MVERQRLKPKHQRLVLAGLALAALVVAGLLAAWGLRNTASYFYTRTRSWRRGRHPIARYGWAAW